MKFFYLMLVVIMLFNLMNRTESKAAQENTQIAENNTLEFENQIKNFGAKQTNKIPETYSKKDAAKNGDITPINITAKQREKINQFIENVADKKPDFIRFVQFTSNEEPIITEYQFNGELIYYRYDASRDSSGRHHRIGEDGTKKKVVKNYCKKLVPNKKMSYLTNCYHYETIEF
jgi:hypothetical protein